MTSWTPEQLGAIGDVTFDHPTGVAEDAIDAAYRSKYGRYGPTCVDPMVAPGARATTLRLNPAPPTTEGVQ